MEFRPDIGQLSPTMREHLAPANLLRAGINLSNFLLVSSRGPQGEPQNLVLLKKTGGKVEQHKVLPVTFVPMTGEAKE